MKNAHKILAFCAVGTLVIASHSSIAKAEEVPVAGMNLVLQNYLQSEDNNVENIIDYLNNIDQQKGISFARVTDYVNIRSAPSEEGDILGKLYNNSAATILEKSGDWYRVKSGSVTGYINAQFLVTGDAAKKLAKEIGTQVAIVTADTLKVREEPSTEAAVLTLAANGEELLVKDINTDWVKVVTEGSKTGYVSADFVVIQQEYEEAVSIEEEQERLQAEQDAEQAERERLAEQAAIRSEQQRRAAASSTREQTQNVSDNASSNNVVIKNTTSSDIRNRIVEYALRFEGNPYVWGGTSLTNGADCSGFTQSVFRDNGISIPRTSRTQAIGGRRISISEMQPGDLIFYAKNGTINHVAIYIGNGKVISASSPETGIRITSYNYRDPYRVVSYIND